jgi:hypothetical protein
MIPYPLPGRPVEVFPSLTRWLSQFSPDLHALANVYVSQRVPPVSRTTYGDTDATAELPLHLLEALACLHQVHLEMQDQVEQHAKRNLSLPFPYHKMMSTLLSLEPVLVHACQESLLLHSALWEGRPVPKIPESSGPSS